ncbi:MAG: zinc ribbon domain-containing protein [Planctomycetota bacterium]|nr:zinc ribbon domain-containing protein [Planctomycetota bacterium]
MPTYVYEVVLEDAEDGEEGQVFEVFQKMSDPPLTKHPQTGQPVRRVFQAPNLPSQYSESRGKALMSDASLKRNGFTKYEKDGNGKYVKTAGVGPKSIKKTDQPG